MFPSRSFSAILLAAFYLPIAGWAVPLQAYPPLYSVRKTIHPTDLVPAGSNLPLAVTGLSATGGVGGYVTYTVKQRGTTSTYVQGFYWNDAEQTLTNFDTSLDMASSMTTCVSANGLAAGVCWTTGLDSQQLGFVWQNDALVTFQSPDDGDIDTVVAVNAAGQVIGTYFGAAGLKRAFLWDGTTSTDLGDMGDPDNSFVWPQAINNAGQVVGTVYTVNTRSNNDAPLSAAFQWQNGVLIAVDGTDDFTRTVAVGFNDAGEILGSYLNPSTTLRNQFVAGGFYWFADTATDLGDLGGGSTVPFFINDAGAITGTTYAADSTLHLFNWQSGTLTDLGLAQLNPGDTSFQISSVDQAGDMAGFVTDVNGQCQTFVQTGGLLYNLASVIRASPGYVADDSNGTQALVNDGGLIACAGFSQGAPVVFLLTADSDGNGLPDGWEQYYFHTIGVNPLAPLAWNSSLTLLQAYQQGLNPVDFYNGQTPTFTITGGNNQRGAAGEFLPLPLTVQVTANGQPLTNAPVTFAVTLSDGVVQRSSNSAPLPTVTVQTDYTGVATVYYRLSSRSNDANQITARPGTGSYAASQVFTEDPTGAAGVNSSPFNPSNVIATMNLDGSADVSWDNNADPTDLESIDIMYKDRTGQWQVLQKVPAGTTSYHISAP